MVRSSAQGAEDRPLRAFLKILFSYGMLYWLVVVLPAPLLRYYAVHEGAGKVKLVGPEFRKSDAAFVLPLDSPLRRKVNSALVTLHDDGTYERIYQKWFGKE
jgi:ABC-type amino acid transport substrate-binding protein